MEREKVLTGEELNQAFKDGLKYLEGLVGNGELILDSGKVLIAHSSERDIPGFLVHLRFPTKEEDYHIDPNKGLKQVYILEKDVLHTTILGDIFPSEESLIGSGWRRTGEMELRTVWKPETPEYNHFIEERKQDALRVMDWLKQNIRQ